MSDNLERRLDRMGEHLRSGAAAPAPEFLARVRSRGAARGLRWRVAALGAMAVAAAAVVTAVVWLRPAPLPAPGPVEGAPLVAEMDPMAPTIAAISRVGLDAWAGTAARSGSGARETLRAGSREVAQELLAGL